ncbi:MAG: 2-dehydropantoate 2-reductase [Acidobacteria bacterium]|nr:MAG: 2-dehydropantoate 2-reductase [Acidobacteriota bacterium]
MRIAIVGSGGVGGYFGGRLGATGVDVTFLARGAHLEALHTRGLRIESPKGNLHLPRVNASDDPVAIGPADIVFFAVKLYDTEGALALLPPLLGPDTVVIPLQNGVDSVAMLTRAVGQAHTAGGTCYVSAVISEPGVIRHTAMDHLIFGELDGTRSSRLEWLLEACRPAGFQATLSTDITVDIWSKFIRLSAFSGTTAVTRSPTVAQARGVAVPQSSLADVAAAFSVVPPEAKSSMLEDLERGRRLELAWLSGAVVRIGREVGIDTPTHRFINAVLKPYANGSLG